MCVPPRRGARWRSQRYCTGFRSCPILSVSFLPTVILHSLHSWCIYIEIDGTFPTKSAHKSTLSVSWSQNRNRYESRPNVVVVPRCRLVVLLPLRPLPHCFLFGRHRSRDADASFDLREGGREVVCFPCLRFRWRRITTQERYRGVDLPPIFRGDKPKYPTDTETVDAPLSSQNWKGLFTKVNCVHVH